MAAFSDVVGDEQDRLLVQQLQDGDVEAFAQLYTRHHRRILRLCERLVHDRHLAEELAQDAFLRAFNAMPRFDGQRRFYPWLAVIARHVAIDHIRRTFRAGEHAMAAGAISEAPETVVERRVQREELVAALHRVKARHRHILHLREFEGLSYDQIAARLGVAPTAVPPLLHRARAALRREYLALTTDRLTRIPLLEFLVRILQGARARASQLSLGLPDPAMLLAPIISFAIALGNISAAPPRMVAADSRIFLNPASSPVTAGLTPPTTHGHNAQAGVPPLGSPAPQEGPLGLPDHRPQVNSTNHVLIPDVIEYRHHDPETSRRQRERMRRENPIFLEYGPVGFSADPEEDAAHWQELASRYVEAVDPR